MDARVKTTQFNAYAEGEPTPYVWAFYRDQNLNRWFLRDYSGYVRPLEARWIDSVPLINLILENHGMKANIS